MKRILISIAVLSLTGCASQDVTKLARELKGDPAIVVGTVTSVYGTAKFVRIGGTTNNVTVNPDGTVTVNRQ